MIYRTIYAYIGERNDLASWNLASITNQTNTGEPTAYLPTIPDSPELLRKSASNYGITARGKIITEIVDYGNLVTSGNNW